MSRAAQVVTIALAAFAASCATPWYGRFAPLRADSPMRRVDRPEFSILVPDASSVSERDDGGVIARETPPPNGEHLVYRIVEVTLAPGVADDEPASMQRTALEHLRTLPQRDDFVVTDTSATTIAGRAAFVLHGVCGAGAADLRFDVLDFFVPGWPKSLVVRCSIPEGQLAASRDGFVAIVNSLQTKLGPPGAGDGEMQWFDGERIALRLPEAWQRQPDEAGALAVFVHEPSGARCDLVTKSTAAPVDLDRVAANWRTEQSVEWPSLAVVSTERSQRAGRDVLHLRGVYRDGGETIVVDDTYAVTRERLDRLLFRMPLADYRGEREALDKAVRSLRWQAARGKS